MDELSIQEKLMCYRIGWETEVYAKSAIEKIILEATYFKSRVNLDNLVAAITSQGDLSTNCVSIPRPKKNDGKFAHPFLEYPHVVYAKIWRWPDACKENLKHRDICNFAFDLNHSFVCVNPYHYDRIVPVPDTFQSTSACGAVQKPEETISKSEPKQVVNIDAGGVTLLPNGAAVPVTKAVDIPSDSNKSGIAQISETAEKDLPFTFTAAPLSSNASPGLFQQVDDSSNSNKSTSPDMIEQVSTKILEALTEKIYAALTNTSEMPIDKSETDNGSSTSKKRDSSSSSTSTDDGFEIVNYDMDIEDGAPSKDNSTSCLPSENQDVTKELGGEVAAKSEPELTPGITDGHNLPKESDRLTEDELPISFDHFLADIVDVPVGNNNVPAPETGIVQENSIKMETENEESKDVVKTEYADGSENKYEKLKTAFVEVVFAATNPCAESRCMNVLKVMDTVQNEFLGESASSKQYEFLKTFLNSGSCAIMSGTSVTPGSSASTNAPYRRKLKVSSPSSRINYSTSLTECLKGLRMPSTNTVPTTPSEGPNAVPLPSVNYSAAIAEYLQGFTSPQNVYPVSSEGLPSTSKNSFMWDSREPIPTVTIEHRAVPFSPQEQPPKINFAANQGINNDQVPKDDPEKARLLGEIVALRKQVRLLETRLQIQKQDEYDKMVLYTNNMRDQYIKTVSRLSELNKVLTNRVTQKDVEIASLTRTFDALEIPSLLDEKDREIDALNDHLLALSAILTNYEEEIQSLKNEKRNLKRNSDADETAEEVSSKRRPDAQAAAESNEDPMTLQQIFDAICAEFEKSNVEKYPENKSSNDILSEESSNDNPTKESSNDIPSKESSNDIPSKESSNGNPSKESSNDIPSKEEKEEVPPNEVPNKDNITPSLESQSIDTLASSLELFQIKEKEQAMTAKMTEMIAEMEVMKITHDKTKSDLEARLRNGAKQYAKLYVKYDRMVRNSQPQE